MLPEWYLCKPRGLLRGRLSCPIGQHGKLPHMLRYIDLGLMLLGHVSHLRSWTDAGDAPCNTYQAYWCEASSTSFEGGAFWFNYVIEIISNSDIRLRWKQYSEPSAAYGYFVNYSIISL